MSKRNPDETAARPQPKSFETKRGEKRALIIAINEYKPEINRLPSCIRDAEKMTELLRDGYGFTSIQKLYDTEATKENVERAFDELFTEVSADDRLVIYFSGHGYQYPVGDVKQEALVLYDAMMPDESLVNHARKLPPGVLTIILDSCFSGGMGHAFLEGDAKVKVFTDVNRPYADMVDDRPVRGFAQRPASTGPVNFLDLGEDDDLNALLFTACSKNETAAAGVARTQHLSAFTYALTSVIEREGKGISNTALMDTLKVDLQTLRFAQTPTLFMPAKLAPLAGRTFLSHEVASAPPSSVKASPVSAPAGAGYPMFSQAQLGLMAQQLAAGIVPFLDMDTLRRAVMTPIRPAVPYPMVQQKDFVTPTGVPVAALAPHHDEAQQKFLGGLLSGLASALPQVVSTGVQIASAMAQRKDFAPPATPVAARPLTQEEAQQKFLAGFMSGLAAVAPHVISALPQVVNTGVQLAGAITGAMGQHKGFVTPTGVPVAALAPHQDEAQQKILPLLGLVPSLIGMFGSGR